MPKHRYALQSKTLSVSSPNAQQYRLISLGTSNVNLIITLNLLLLIPHLLRAGQDETLILPLSIITQPQHNGMFTISQRLGLIQNDGNRR